MSIEELKQLMQRFDVLLTQHPPGYLRLYNAEQKDIRGRLEVEGLRIGTDDYGMVIVWLSTDERKE